MGIAAFVRRGYLRVLYSLHREMYRDGMAAWKRSCFFHCLSGLLYVWGSGFIMCCVYLKIFKIVSNQSKRISAEVKKVRSINGLETRANVTSARKGALTVLIVIGTYMACWSPFCLLLIVQTAHGKTTGGPTADLTTMFVGFANSAYNPLIYSIRYKGFRLAVKRMFTRSN